MLAMHEFGRILQLMGLVIVPASFLVAKQLVMFSVLALGAGVFLLGYQLTRGDGP